MNQFHVRIIACIAVLIGFLSLNANAEKFIDAGVKVGEKAPALQINSSETLKSLSGEEGLVLVFFRSADWCPYCKRHLVEINDWIIPLAAKGYKVAAVSYDDTETLAAFTKEKSLSFPLLSDKDTATVQAYKILNTDYKPGDEAYGIPLPGAYIIDASGTVKYKYFYEGYKKRVTLDMITSELEK